MLNIKYWVYGLLMGENPPKTKQLVRGDRCWFPVAFKRYSELFWRGFCEILCVVWKQHETQTHLEAVDLTVDVAQTLWTV